MKETKQKFYLILHNIRSIYNAGVIFRTAEGAGVRKIFLTGYTPLPIDRFGKPRKDFLKTSLGAERFILWEKIKNIAKLIKQLKKEKVFIAGVENAPQSVYYRNFFKTRKEKIKKSAGLALILGNETQGLSNAVLERTGAVIFIPMLGKKESLNVAVAAGIALYETSHHLHQ